MISISFSSFITKRIKNTPRVYYYEYYLKLRNQNTKKIIKKKIQIIESTTLARKSDLQIAELKIRLMRKLVGGIFPPLADNEIHEYRNKVESRSSCDG